MASITRLLVLGAVNQFQPVHGYFLRRELMSWHVDEWARVEPGSIYSALRSLEKDQYIEPAGTESEGKYPVRVLYNITATGHTEFLRIFRDILWSVKAFDTQIAIALVSFMHALSRAEVEEAIDFRLSTIDALIRTNEYNIRDTLVSDTTPAYVREIFEFSSAQLSAQRSWAQVLRDRIHAGEYRFADNAEPHEQA